MDSIFFLLVSLLPFLFLALLVAIVLGAVSKRYDMPEPVFPKHLGWAVLIGIIGLNVFAYESDFGIGLGLFFASLFVALLLTFEPRRRTPAVWAIAAIGILACAFFGWRANEFVQQVNIAVMVLSLGALLLLRAVEEEDWHGVWIVMTGSRLVRRAFLHLPALGNSLKSGAKSRSRFMIVARTVVITLIVLVFFSTLLSEADPIFDRLVATLRDQLAGRTALSLLLAAFLGVALTMRAVEKRSAPHKLSILSFQEVFVPVAAMLGLFAVFLFIQAKYLFGPPADFAAFDLTYSEYVRKGFMEVLIATFFGSIVAYVVILKQHALENAKHVTALKVVNVLLVVALFLLLASALKRDWLYMDVYGVTRVRMIGEIFLAWLAGMLLLLLALNLVPQMREKHFLGGALALSACIFLWLNGTNMDLTIARATPPRNQPKDLFYLSLLSEDAALEWHGLASQAAAVLNETLPVTTPSDTQIKRLADAKLATITLLSRLNALRDKHAARRWQDWNWSTQSALPHADMVSSPVRRTLACVLREMEDYQRANRVELYELESKRVFEFAYPFVIYDPYASDYARSMESMDFNDPYVLEGMAGDGDQKPGPCPVTI